MLHDNDLSTNSLENLHMAPKDFPIGNLVSIEILSQSKDNHASYMMKILPIILTTNGVFERLNRLGVQSDAVAHIDLTRFTSFKRQWSAWSRARKTRNKYD